MQTQRGQIRITLPVQLQSYLRAKADKLGLSLSAYVKHLIINDVKDVLYSVYQMSDRAIADFEKAKQDEKEGRLVKVDKVDDFLENL